MATSGAIHPIDAGTGRDLGEVLSRIGGGALFLSSAVIFLWFGALKFVAFEAEGLVGIISNNPLISWLYPVFGIQGGARFLGVYELATGLLIAGRVLTAKLSALGGAMGAGAYFLTITCLFTTPGVIQPGYEGTLALSPAVGAFLIKDIVLFSACLWICGASVRAVTERR